MQACLRVCWHFSPVKELLFLTVIHKSHILQNVTFVVAVSFPLSYIFCEGLSSSFLTLIFFLPSSCQLCMWGVCLHSTLSLMISFQKTSSPRILSYASYPWKALSETMRVTGRAVLSLPPSPNLFRIAPQWVRKKRREATELKEFLKKNNSLH